MKNYVLVYYTTATMADGPNDEVMAAWGAWFGKLGDKLVDGGNPFNSGAKAVQKSGVSAVSGEAATGYSIVKASSMDDAVELCKDCPLLQDASGTVQVYETMPM